MSTIVKIRIRHLSLVLLSVMLSIDLLSSDLLAQTWSARTESVINISRYKHVETCFAVSGRVLDSVQARDPVLADTLHYSFNSAMAPLPSTIVEITRQCLSNFAPETVVAESPYMIQALYLRASEDAKAQIVLNRVLASIPNNRADLLMDAVDNGMRTYLQARPSRVKEALNLYSTIERLATPPSAISQIRALSSLALGAWRAQDTAIHSIAVQKMVAQIKRMSDDEWNGADGVQATAMVWFPIRNQYALEFEKRLKQSTEDYLSFQEKLFTDIIGREARMSLWTTPDKEIGTVGPEVHGNFWFPQQQPSTIYPRKGKVTLLVSIMPHADQWVGVPQTLHAAAVMRRLKRQIPELDIVIIASTKGYLKLREPMSPAVEAGIIDSMFRQWYSMPAVVGVTNTEFWRLPGYDKRRINEQTKNEEHGYDNGLNFHTTLFDKEGKIVSNLTSVVWGEEILERLIPLLQARP